MRLRTIAPITIIEHPSPVKYKSSMPPLSVSSSNLFNNLDFSFSRLLIVCRNLCERLNSKIIVGESRHGAGKKYCRRCKVYYCHNCAFCPCCGMALRTSPTSKRDKEGLRQLKLGG